MSSGLSGGKTRVPRVHGTRLLLQYITFVALVDFIPRKVATIQIWRRSERISVIVVSAGRALVLREIR